MANRKIVPQERTCPVCQTVFEVGGRGRRMYRTIYCSRECNAQDNVKNPVVRTLTPEVAAYLAGLIDGEGSIVKVKEGKVRPLYRLSVTSTDRKVLDWCRDITGVGAIILHKMGSAKHNTSWNWQSYSQNVHDILTQVRPYMIIKTDRADAVINGTPFPATTRRGGRPVGRRPKTPVLLVDDAPVASTPISLALAG